VNLNTMTPFLLQNSELSGTLLNKSVQDFVTFRTNSGPLPHIEDYKDFFQASALRSLYCAQSSFNINTADEIMLEKVLAARTGSEALASTVRAGVRQFRANRQIMSESDWEAMIGADKDAVGELVGIQPEVDVNTAPLVVLQALLRDPDWKLDQPDAKLQMLLAGRATKPWTDGTLLQALGIDKNSLLLQYLGTRCRVAQVTIPTESQVMTLTIAIDYSTDSPPKLALRLLDTRWNSP